MLIRFVDTAAFNFQGDILCFSCTKDIAEGACLDLGALPIQDASVHELISIWAARRMVPAYATREYYTYDTDLINENDIPRPIEHVYDGETCDNCGRKLDGERG